MNNYKIRILIIHSIKISIIFFQQLQSVLYADSEFTNENDITDYIQNIIRKINSIFSQNLQQIDEVVKFTDTLNNQVEQSRQFSSFMFAFANQFQNIQNFKFNFDQKLIQICCSIFLELGLVTQSPTMSKAEDINTMLIQLISNIQQIKINLSIFAYFNKDQYQSIQSLNLDGWKQCNSFNKIFNFIENKDNDKQNQIQPNFSKKHKQKLISVVTQVQENDSVQVKVNTEQVQNNMKTKQHCEKQVENKTINALVYNKIIIFDIDKLSTQYTANIRQKLNMNIEIDTYVNETTKFIALVQIMNNCPKQNLSPNSDQVNKLYKQTISLDLQNVLHRFGYHDHEQILQCVFGLLSNDQMKILQLLIDRYQFAYDNIEKTILQINKPAVKQYPKKKVEFKLNFDVLSQIQNFINYLSNKFIEEQIGLEDDRVRYVVQLEQLNLQNYITDYLHQIRQNLKFNKLIQNYFTKCLSSSTHTQTYLKEQYGIINNSTIYQFILFLNRTQDAKIESFNMNLVLEIFQKSEYYVDYVNVAVFNKEQINLILQMELNLKQNLEQPPLEYYIQLQEIFKFQSPFKQHMIKNSQQQTFQQQIQLQFTILFQFINNFMIQLVNQFNYFLDKIYFDTDIIQNTFFDFDKLLLQIDKLDVDEIAQEYCQQNYAYVINSMHHYLQDQKDLYQNSNTLINIQFYKQLETDSNTIYMLITSIIQNFSQKLKFPRIEENHFKNFLLISQNLSYLGNQFDYEAGLFYAYYSMNQDEKK